MTARKSLDSLTEMYLPAYLFLVEYKVKEITSLTKQQRNHHFAVLISPLI